MMNRLGWLVIALALTSACKEDKPADYGSKPAKPIPKAPTAPVGSGDQAEEGPPPTRVRIDAKPIQVGSVITSETSSTTQLTFTGNGRTASIDTTRSELRHIEVVETDGASIRKARVHYESQTRAEREGAIEQEFGEALHGLKFVVWSEGGTLKATTDTGQPVPAEQATEVLGDLTGEIGEVPGLERVLLGRDWTYGTPVTLGPADLTALRTDMPEGTKAVSGVVTALTQRKGVATFQLDLTIEIGELGKNGFTARSTATVGVDIAAGHRLDRKASSALDGVLDGMQGKGTLTETEELRYR